jgi:geranylgeranyl diphosphate synthase type II
MSGLGWVEVALEEVLEVPAPRPATYEGRALAEALRDASTGGKRFRPALVAAAHTGLGGTRDEAVPAVAAAVELLHTAFVVHDDVIDGDATRRGRPTVPARFREDAVRAGAGEREAETYGLAGALLTGDLALTAAVRSVAMAPAPRPVVERMLDLVDHTLSVTASGELADVRYATHDHWPSLAEVLSAEERKTAVYSFALPLQLGAVLAGAGEPTVGTLAEVGRHLGLAFQLRDDLLGVFGDEQATGKSTLSDLREGKCTALVVHASGTPHWEEALPHFGDRDLTAERAAVVRSVLERSGSRAFVEELVVDYVDTAERCAAEAGLPPELVGWLASLCVVPSSGAA